VVGIPAAVVGVEEWAFECAAAPKLDIVQLLLLLLNEVQVIVDRPIISDLIIGVDKVRVHKWHALRVLITAGGYA
jgi:hypothetical protein